MYFSEFSFDLGGWDALVRLSYVSYVRAADLSDLIRIRKFQYFNICHPYL